MTKAHDGAIIRVVEARDVTAIADIYNHYIGTSIVTFEEERATAAEITRRVTDVQSISLPWLVAEEGGRVTGYACVTRWRTRTAYRFSTEITAYLIPECIGHGIGSKLYSQILSLLRAQQVHAVMGGIALPNEASIALHEKFGFRKVAHFQEVGFKFDRWIDVGYWQLTL